MPPEPGAYRALNRTLVGLILAGLAWSMTLLACARHLPPRATLSWSQLLLGMPCPLCGMTRGLTDLARGDVASALAHNPLALTAAVLIVLELAYRLAAGTTSGARRLLRWGRLDGWLHAWGAVAYSLYAAVSYMLRGLAGGG